MSLIIFIIQQIELLSPQGGAYFHDLVKSVSSSLKYNLSNTWLTISLLFLKKRIKHKILIGIFSTLWYMQIRSILFLPPHCMPSIAHDA